jgi:hypothetical protein
VVGYRRVALNISMFVPNQVHKVKDVQLKESQRKLMVTSTEEDATTLRYKVTVVAWVRNTRFAFPQILVQTMKQLDTFLHAHIQRILDIYLKNHISHYIL